MSKKLLTLLQALLLFGSVGQAFAGNQTYDVYENGRHVGTATYPAGSGIVGRLNGTGLTLRPVRDEAQIKARREAAERRVAEWNRQEEQRRAAAQRQQEAWKRQNEQRHQNAVAREQQWRLQAEQRRVAMHRQMEEWNRQFEQRHRTAEERQQAWGAEAERRRNAIMQMYHSGMAQR